MITEYPTTNENIEIAKATPDAHVWIDGGRIVVFTGKDIPPPPPVQPVMIEEAVALAAIKAAGKTDAEAKALLSAEVGKVGV